MQRESTLVAIRERGFLEVMDLALQVLRHCAPGVVAWGLVGVVPWALLNFFLVESLWGEDLSESPESWSSLLMFQLWLASWEMPLATAGVTLYLGQRMFRPRVDHRLVVRQWCGSLGQLLLLQGLGRGMFHMFCISLFVPYWFWPYLNEVILLERNRLFGRTKESNQTHDQAPIKLGTLNRAARLHSQVVGESIFRWLVATVVGAVLLGSWSVALSVLVTWVQTKTLSPWAWMQIVFPTATWCVVVFFAVVRFLSYLDLRIRKEGWEIELQLKTQAARLAMPQV